MSAGHRRRQGERLRALEEENRRLRAALERFANPALWEPTGERLYYWDIADEGHPADVAQRALLLTRTTDGNP